MLERKHLKKDDSEKKKGERTVLKGISEKYISGKKESEK